MTKGHGGSVMVWETKRQVYPIHSSASFWPLRSFLGAWESSETMCQLLHDLWEPWRLWMENSDKTFASKEHAILIRFAYIFKWFAHPIFDSMSTRMPIGWGLQPYIICPIWLMSNVAGVLPTYLLTYFTLLYFTSLACLLACWLTCLLAYLLTYSLTHSTLLYFTLLYFTLLTYLFSYFLTFLLSKIG